MGRGGAAGSRRHGSAPSRRAPRGSWAGLARPRPLAESVPFREPRAVGSDFQSSLALRPEPVRLNFWTGSVSRAPQPHIRGSRKRLLGPRLLERLRPPLPKQGSR